MSGNLKFNFTKIKIGLVSQLELYKRVIGKDPGVTSKQRSKEQKTVGR